MVHLHSMVNDLKNDILEESLNDVIFDGWRWENIEKTCEKLGHQRSMAYALFPDRLNDVIRHFSTWADQKMLTSLSDINPDDLRIRDRIKTATLHRFKILTPYKEAVRYSLGHWTHPVRTKTAGKSIWQTADTIWNWAGDDAQDYNHYTKRALLSSVIVSTSLAWLNNEKYDLDKTEEFLDRRIENVLFLGKNIGRFKNLFSFLPLPSRKEQNA